MMHRIVITALSEKGKIALREHMKACLNLPMLEKAAFNKMWRQNLLCTDPYTIEMIMCIKSIEQFFDPGYFIDRTIYPVMRENGALVDIDYTVETKTE